MSDAEDANDDIMEVGFFDAVEAEDDVMSASLRQARSDNDVPNGSSSEDSSSRERMMEAAASPPQRARDHSYLPGPSHPLLYDEAPLQQQQQQQLPSDEAAGVQFTTTKPLTEIPILELPGVVLFPGCTIPIRLRNRSWIQYLGRQIDASRKVGSPDFGRTVQLGILTLEDNAIVANRTRATAAAGGGDDDPRRRSSLLRRGVTNTRRQQRLSRILQLEIFGNDEMDSDDDDDDSDTETNRSNRNNSGNSNNVPRRNLHPFIGRMGTIATITYTHGDAVLDSPRQQSFRNNNNNNNSATGVWQQHAEEQGELILKAVGTTRFQVESYLEYQSFAEVQVFQVQEYQQDHHPLSLPTSQMLGMRRMPPCTIQSTHERRVSEQGMEESPTDENEEMVVHDDDGNTSDTHGVAKQFMAHHESLIRHLTAVTPIPYLVYQQTWPWRLVGQMVQMLEETKAATQTRNDSLSGEDDNSSVDTTGRRKSSLLASLAELLHQESSLLENPTQFSFWMASNMPLSIEEKLKLHHISCTVERLKRLKVQLTDLTRPAVALCCQGCHTPLARVDAVFTVGGADGTTGNYVNEHGFIHQVLTLRRVRESKLYCAGRASTENSYFPGYSWTITYCNRCASLLGWTFNWVGDGGRIRPSNSEDHPPSFFGFMSSSLVTRSLERNSTNNSD